MSLKNFVVALFGKTLKDTEYWKLVSENNKLNADNHFLQDKLQQTQIIGNNPNLIEDFAILDSSHSSLQKQFKALEQKLIEQSKVINRQSDLIRDLETSLEYEKEKNKPKKVRRNTNQNITVTTNKSTLNIVDEEISFFYTNADDESDYRNLLVRSVTPYYIKGTDLDKHASRTFRKDRIEGSITIKSTGQIVWPEDL